MIVYFSLLDLEECNEKRVPQVKKKQATDITAVGVGNLWQLHMKNVLRNTPDIEQLSQRWVIIPAVSFAVSEENPQSLSLTCQSENTMIHRLVFDCSRTL